MIYFNLQIDHINLITQSICALLLAQPTLSDNIPSFGHLQRLLQIITTIKTNTTEHKLLIYKSFILILHQVSLNEVSLGSYYLNEYKALVRYIRHGQLEIKTNYFLIKFFSYV